MARNKSSTGKSSKPRVSLSAVREEAGHAGAAFDLAVEILTHVRGAQTLAQRLGQAQDHCRGQAERWLRDGLTAAGLDAQHVTRLKGSDPRKLDLAELLWGRTTVSQE